MIPQRYQKRFFLMLLLQKYVIFSLSTSRNIGKTITGKRKVEGAAKVTLPSPENVGLLLWDLADMSYINRRGRGNSKKKSEIHRRFSQDPSARKGFRW